MFEQFIPREQPLALRVAHWLQLSGLFLFLLSESFLFRRHALPDVALGILVGVALGLQIAAVTLHIVMKWAERRSTAEAAIGR